MRNDELESLKLEVAEVGRLMQEAGLIAATWGNISALTSDRRLVIITPSGLEKGRLNPDDMIVMSVEGEIIEGKHKPSIEAPCT